MSAKKNIKTTEDTDLRRMAEESARAHAEAERYIYARLEYMRAAARRLRGEKS
jgi:hypothetical protein